MLRKMHPKHRRLPREGGNPCLQASWLPGASRCVPSQMDSRLRGNDGKIVRSVTSVDFQPHSKTDSS
jgi:hypothetical protein